VRTVLVTIVGPADRQRSAGAAASGELAPRRDLSLPADVPLGELLPTLVRLFGALGGGPARAPESWGLVDPSGSPLDTSVSLGANGVLNGALLQLQPGSPAHGDPPLPDFAPQAEQPPVEWSQPAEPTPLPASRSANRWRDTFVALVPPSDQRGEPALPPAAPPPAAPPPAAPRPPAQPPEVAPHPSPRPDAGADFEPVVPIGDQRLWGAPSPFSVVDRPPGTGARRDPPVTDDRASTEHASVYHMDARWTSTPPAHRGTTAYPAAANSSALDTAAIDPPAVQPSAIDPYAVHPAAVDRSSAGPAAARPAAAPAAPDLPAQSAVAPGSASGGWFASPATNGQAATTNAATNGGGRAATRPPSERAIPSHQNGTGSYPEAPEPSARATWTGNGSSQWAWGGPDGAAPRARQAPGHSGTAAPPDETERAGYLLTGHPGAQVPPGQPRGRQGERGPAADRPVPGPGPRARSVPLERARRAWRSADYPRHLDAGIVAPRLRRGVTIAVISPKPGTGRTLVATLLAATLVELRPDQVRVVAGGAAPRSGRGRRGAARQQNQGQQHGSFEQFAGRLPGHAPVPDPDPFPDTLSETGGGGLTAEAEAVALGGVVLVDCVAGLDGSPARTAIGLADQLVLVTDADPATGSLAVEAATPLLEAGRSVTLVVNQRPLRGRRLDVGRLNQMLPLAGGPVVVSYEPASGAALDEGRFDLREAPSGWRRAGRELAYIVTADWRTRGYAR
jgi:WXG100 protein secretion system (Wss), protein YukD